MENFTELLKDVPPGHWAALSHTETGQRVVAHAVTLHDAMEAAKAAGELNPVMTGKPLAERPLIL